MSTVLEPPPPSTRAPVAPSMPPPGPVDLLYRLSVEQYHAMADAGILNRSDRVELLEGLLVAKMTKHSPRIVATDLTQTVLMRTLPAGWFASMQNPITIVESNSEPEPDAKVVRGEPRDYLNRRVTPADVALVVEVADSSLHRDQVTKKAVYARAAIPIYWLLNIPAYRLEAYADPTGPDPSPDYRRRVDHGPDDHVPLILDGQEVARIAVRDLLPRNRPPTADR